MTIRFITSAHYRAYWTSPTALQATDAVEPTVQTSETLEKLKASANLPKTFKSSNAMYEAANDDFNTHSHGIYLGCEDYKLMKIMAY